MATPFKAIVADPPWTFRDKLGKRGTESRYRCMLMQDLVEFPIPEMNRDSYLFLWRVAALPQAALDLAIAWGFAPKTELVWVKETKTGKLHFGMGHHLRASHEVCLVATRGRPKPLSRSVRSVFRAPVGEHSRKPDEFYEIVERFCSGPYVELFARRRRPGWACYGDELDVQG